MAIYRIPLSPTPQRFTINLGGTEYGIKLRFRNHLEAVTVVDIPQLANGIYPQYTSGDLVGFSRNSIATYTDSTGKIIKVEPNKPRFTPSGLLVESEGKNTIPYSENFSDSSWAKTGVGASSAPAITPNCEIAPDGTLTADKVQFGNNPSVTEYSTLSCAFSGISAVGVPAAQCLWIKSVSGSNINLFFRFSGTLPTGSSQVVTVTGEWRKFDQYLASPATASLGMVLRTDYSINAGESPAVYVWGAQRHNGVTQVGTYIPTDGSAVTRPEEIAAIGHTEHVNRQGGWVIDISDRAGAQLVNGIPLVTGCDLLAQHKHLGFAGELRVQTSDAPDETPTFVNLGEQSHLYWITT